MLFWLKGKLELGFVGHMEKLLTASMNEAPRARIPETVGDAIRKNLCEQGMKPEKIRQVVREAQKQTDFLIVLIRNLHHYVWWECTLNPPYILLLYERFERLVEQCVHRDKLEPKAWDLWRAVLMRRLFAMWQVKNTIEGISVRYYDGHQLLFAENESELNQQIESLEKLAKHYNRLAKDVPSLTAINMGRHSSSVQKRALDQVGELIAIAKSTTLDDFGEHEAASKILKPYALAELESIRRSTSR